MKRMIGVLLAALALECRRLLRQLPARDMQQALSY